MLLMIADGIPLFIALGSPWPGHDDMINNLDCLSERSENLEFVGRHFLGLVYSTPIVI